MVNASANRQMAIVSGVSCNSKKIRMRQFTTIITTITLFLLTGFLVGKSENVEKNLNVIDSLKQDYVSRMNGVWVMTDYIVDIQKNKSPLTSSIPSNIQFSLLYTV